MIALFAHCPVCSLRIQWSNTACRYTRFADATLPGDRYVRIWPMSWQGHTSMRVALLVGDADDVEPADGSDTLREEVRQVPLSTRAMETDGGRATAFEVLSSAGAVASYFAAQTGERSYFRGQIPSDKTNYRLKLLQDTPESSGWVHPERIIDGNVNSNGYWTPPADSCGPQHEHFAIVDLQVRPLSVKAMQPCIIPHRHL